MKVYYKEKGKGFRELKDVEAISHLLGTDTSYIDNAPLRELCGKVDPQFDPKTSLFCNFSSRRLKCFG